MSIPAAPLRQLVRTFPSALVGYSGGVDSALLAVVLRQELGRDRMLAAIGRSASYPLAQWATARRVAERFDVPLIEIATHELEDPSYLDQGHVEPLGYPAGGCPLGEGIGGAATDGGQHAVSPQLLAEHHGQQGRIHPAGVADERGGEGANQLAQRGGRDGHGGIVPTYAVPIKGQLPCKNRIFRRLETYYSDDTLTKAVRTLRLVGNTTSGVPK